MVVKNNKVVVPSLTWTDIVNGFRMYNIVSSKVRKCRRKKDWARMTNYMLLRTEFIEATKLYQRGKEKCLKNGDICE